MLCYEELNLLRNIFCFKTFFKMTYFFKVFCIILCYLHFDLHPQGNHTICTVQSINITVITLKTLHFDSLQNYIYRKEH